MRTFAIYFFSICTIYGRSKLKCVRCREKSLSKLCCASAVKTLQYRTRADKYVSTSLEMASKRNDLRERKFFTRHFFEIQLKCVHRRRLRVYINLCTFCMRPFDLCTRRSSCADEYVLYDDDDRRRRCLVCAIDVRAASPQRHCEFVAKLYCKKGCRKN